MSPYRKQVPQAERTVTGLCGYTSGQRQSQKAKGAGTSSLLASVVFDIRQKGMGFVIYGLLVLS